MIKIQVTSTPVETRSGISKAGKPYTMRTQWVYAHTVSPDGVLCDFPEKFAISLEDGQQPYPAGMYTLQPSSLQVKADSFGKPLLEIDRPRLVALPAQSAKAAA